MFFYSLQKLPYFHYFIFSGSEIYKSLTVLIILISQIIYELYIELYLYNQDRALEIFNILYEDIYTYMYKRSELKLLFILKWYTSIRLIL